MEESTGFSNWTYISGEMGKAQGRRRQDFFFWLSNFVIARGMSHSPLDIITGNLTFSVFEEELCETLTTSQRTAMICPHGKKI